MSAITPSTNVKLLKLPIELDNENQLTFASATAQYNYFNGLPKLAVNDFTYQRKDGVIRFPGCIDDLVGYNYAMYQNTAFGNKWFYAYIDKMTFVNPEMTDIHIRTDAFQTWQFDIQFLESFVEREHVNDDTIGKHTVDEGLDTGEFMINETTHFYLSPNDPSGDYGTNWYVCFVLSDRPYDDPTNLPWPQSSNSGSMGSAYSPLHYVCVPSTNNYADCEKIMRFISHKAETLQNVYMVPVTCVDTTQGHQETWHSATFDDVVVYGLNSSYSALNSSIWQSDVLDGQYSPRNNKLYCYPYSYLRLNNKSGSDVIYKWEEMPNFGSAVTDSTGQYFRSKTIIVPSASLSAKLYPTRYKHKEEDSAFFSLLDYGINFGKIPICAWTSDYYTNWLTQNGVNNAIKVGAGILGIGLGAGLIATGVGAGAGATIIAGASGVVSGATSIASSLESNRQAEIAPDQSGGDVNTGDVVFAYARTNITAYCMTIKKEFAEIIDKYFDMYGYKVNIVKTPNIAGRRNWNYVKTIRGKIHGYIPKEDLNTISGMLDNGVTFWHSASTFLDYSQANDIISANT